MTYKGYKETNLRCWKKKRETGDREAMYWNEGRGREVNVYKRKKQFVVGTSRDDYDAPESTLIKTPSRKIAIQKARAYMKENNKC